MMAHYQNTERLQALLKKHQSENSPTLHWFLYFQGWNLESLPCSNWRRLTSECTPLSAGSQRLLTCIPFHWLWGASFTLLNGLIFNIFFFFHPADNKQTEEVSLTGFPHEPAPPPCPPHHCSSSPARPAALSITEVASTELLRPSSSSINKHSWRPTSHWAVQGPQKTRPEALGRLKLFWETSCGANIALCNYSITAKSVFRNLAS